MNWIKDFRWLGYCYICGAEMWEEVKTGTVFTDQESLNHICTLR